MDIEQAIRTIVEPLVANPEAIIIRRMDSTDDLDKKDQHYLIACDQDDIRRLIGRHGVIADSIRKIVSIGAREENKRVHIKFESFDDEE